MSWMVVLHTASPCDEWPDMPCLQIAIGPFETNDEAAAWLLGPGAPSIPDWTRPHLVLMTSTDVWPQ